MQMKARILSTPEISIPTQTSFTEQRLNVQEGKVTKIPAYTRDLEQYVYDRCYLPHPLLKKIRRESAHVEMNYMMTGPDQASLLQMLVKLSGAKRILEVGCYLGYSTLAMASALPDDGMLISLDHNPKWSLQAQSYFEEANLATKIDLRVGEALEQLPLIKNEIENGSPEFDFVFIDADKINSFNYYLQSIELVKSGGVLLIDNVLWRGHILDENDTSDRVQALRQLNDFVANDPRVESMILTVSDGMLFLRKK